MAIANQLPAKGNVAVRDFVREETNMFLKLVSNDIWDVQSGLRYLDREFRRAEKKVSVTRIFTSLRMSLLAEWQKRSVTDFELQTLCWRYF
jgi:hypothetical protein